MLLCFGRKVAVHRHQKKVRDKSDQGIAVGSAGRVGDGPGPGGFGLDVGVGSGVGVGGTGVLVRVGGTRVAVGDGGTGVWVIVAVGTGVGDTGVRVAVGGRAVGVGSGVKRSSTLSSSVTICFNASVAKASTVCREFSIWRLSSAHWRFSTVNCMFCNDNRSKRQNIALNRANRRMKRLRESSVSLPRTRSNRSLPGSCTVFLDIPRHSPMGLA